jgi:glycerophosphoryl diester phosphodiesterase
MEGTTAGLGPAAVRRAVVGAALLLAGCAALAAPSAGALELHAHRGGPLENGSPVASENSIGAAERAAARWRPDYVEIDVKYTADGVPVNIHDPTLDRTTVCTGRIDEHTLAELSECPIDVIGTGEAGDATFRRIADPTEGVPTLREMLRFSQRTGTRLNVEIKNVPNDADFTSDSAAFVDPIIDAIHEMGMLSRDHVLIQSFWPPDLDRAAARIAELVPDPDRRPFVHLLTLQGFEGAVPFAAGQGYDGIGPQWPPAGDPEAFVDSAHAAGLRVVPWTLNEADEIAEAIVAGADGVITDDMARANRVAGRPGPPALRARLRARRTQRSLRRVVAGALCRGSDCRASVRGRVRVDPPGPRIRAFPISVRRIELAEGSWSRIRVAIPRRARRAARRALSGGGTAHARIRMRAADRFSGRHRVRVRRIALRR